MADDDDSPLNRRQFFRSGLRELFKPLGKVAAPLERVLDQIHAMDAEVATAAAHAAKRPPAAAADPSPLGPVLRPPGALDERAFRDACSRCGECVRVCPVQAIKIDPAGLRGNGVPYVDADASACVLCDGLPCMHACPSGALVPTPVGHVDMGTAAWHEPTCLRTAGEPCTICVDACPIGEVAIVLDTTADPAGKVRVIDDGCTGCGVCQNRCPTSPKSITVTPTAAMPAAAAGPISRPRGR